MYEVTRKFTLAKMAKMARMANTARVAKGPE